MKAIRWNPTILIAVILVIGIATGTVNAEKGIFAKRYVFFLRGWKTSKAMEENMLIMERAAAAGYNGLIFGNSGMNRMHTLKKDDSFFTNFKQFRAKAKQHGLVLCPNYAYQLVPSFHSLTVAEAFPVRGTPFGVGANGVVAVEPDTNLAIENPGFEGAVGELPDKWKTFGLAAGSQVFVDASGRSGKGSICFQNLKANEGSGLRQTINVKPFRAYEIRVWIKTQGFTNSDPANPRWIKNPANMAQVAIWGNTWGHWVSYLGGGKIWHKQRSVQATQNWHEYRMNFCSVANSSVKIWIQPVGYRCRPAGKIWFDDISIREIGLVETMRRSTTPVIVKSATSTGVSFQEGKDFLIEAETDYMAQGKIIIPDGSAIKPGDRLSVDWSILADQQTNTPSGAWCDPQAFQYLIDDNLLLHEMTGGLGAYHIATGEWRDANWDPVCMDLYGTAGAYMAGATLGLEATCRLFNPKMDVYIKNDMYDPYHNVRVGDRQYYMCNGPLQGSWNGVSESATVLNWRPSSGEVGSANNFQVKSFLFWSGLGPEFKIKPHRQMIRFNCQAGNLHGIDEGLANIAAAEKLGMTGMVGCVYNTWDGRYEAFRSMEALAQLCKDAGRWGTNPCPLDHGCDYDIEVDTSKLVPLPLGVKKDRADLSRSGVVLRAYSSHPGAVTVEYQAIANSQMRISLVNILGQRAGNPVSRKDVVGGRRMIRIASPALGSGLYVVKAECVSREGVTVRMVKRVPVL